MELDALLGIDWSDPEELHVSYLLDEDERLIESLVAHRKRAGLTQQQVAEHMGIDKSGVSKIESGSRDLLQSTLRRYMLAIGAVGSTRVEPVQRYADRRTRDYSRVQASEPASVSWLRQEFNEPARSVTYVETTGAQGASHAI